MSVVCRQLRIFPTTSAQPVGHSGKYGASGTVIPKHLQELPGRRAVFLPRSSNASDGDVSKPPQPPAGVTLPPQQPEVPPPIFGFVSFAETINSRAAMIGFFSLLAVEMVAGRPILELLGWQIGNGINIGF